MSPRLRIAATTAGFWSVWAVGHAIALAGAIAEGARPAPSGVVLCGLVYMVPLTVVGGWLLLQTHQATEPGSGIVARSLRMGLAVALFGVLLSWGLVLYAAYVATLVAP